MNIIRGSFVFPSHSGSGPVVQETVVRDVGDASNNAVAFLTGFDVEYGKHDDHHLGRLIINVEVVRVVGPVITVRGTFGLRDWSGNWDDAYDGTVNFAVVTFP